MRDTFVTSASLIISIVRLYDYGDYFNLYSSAFDTPVSVASQNANPFSKSSQSKLKLNRIEL